MLSAQRPYYAFQNVSASGKGIVSMPDFDGDNTVFPIELNAAIFKRPGRYVVVKSATPLTNYVGATASFVGTTVLRVREVTPAGSGEVVNFGGTNYYCIVVTVG